MWSKICSMDEALCERLRGCTAGYTRELKNSLNQSVEKRRQLSADSDPPLEKYSIEGEGNS